MSAKATSVSIIATLNDCLNSIYWFSDSGQFIGIQLFIPPHPSPTALSHVRGGIFVLRAKITKIFGLRMKDREINRSKHYGAYTLLAGLLVEDEKRLHIHLYSGIYLPRSPAAGQPDTSHYSRTLYRQGSKRQKNYNGKHVPINGKFVLSWSLFI